MCWLTTHAVSVPTWRGQRTRDAVFQLRLQPQDASSSSVNIERPLSAFHALRVQLLQLTQSTPVPSRRPRWVRRVVKTKRAPLAVCACEARCPFAASVHATLETTVAPLPALASHLPFQNHKKTLEDQRATLESWLRALHACFADGFSAPLLQAKYQRGDCAVMNAYASFLDAKSHFQVVTATAMRQPLALRAWRAERDQAAIDDISLLEDDDDDLLEEDDYVKPLAVAAQPAAIPQDSATTDLLPRLEVKRVGLATLQTFLEDFCETILAQHGQDIAELQSPELTMARRWEIALYVACRIGHSYGAQLILFYYADANVAMEDGTTCLHIASRMGRASIVSLLLQEGAEVDEPNKAGITPLIAACRNGCTEVAKLLLDAGAQVCAASERGTQPIHAAIVSESAEVVELLLAAGANVRATTSSGLTPLHFAARLGSVALSELLLKHNADPEQQTKSGSDAIMIATTNGHMEICELFQKEMDRKNVLSSSGGKLFHRFKKAPAPSTMPRRSEILAQAMRHRGESQEDANSVILMHERRSVRV